MKEVKDITACVVDHGLGIPVAERLARDCKRVIYFSEWREGFSTVNKAAIGWGLPNVERCFDFWKIKDDVDLWVFPDIQFAGEQLELESQGRKVWGSRDADTLETNRELFMRVLGKLGLDVPTFKVCDGITELRTYLRDKEDCYIKISKYRGSLETKHWRNWRLDENLLDLWAVRFGIFREHIPFLVFDAINTPLEIGGDTYNVWGRWPSTMLHGIERKDEAYFAAVTARDEMPDVLQDVLDAFQPILRDHRYTNEWSMEVRVKDNKSYFNDATCRLGLPSTGSQLELWSNWSEIVWAGANGELVEPIPTAKFSAESLLRAKGEDAVWPTVEIPEGLRQWCKLADCCEVDGLRAWPRSESGESDAAGWLVAIGDTPTETLENLKQHVKQLPDGLTAEIAPIADVIKEIETEEKEGIDFSGQPIPEPAVVLEDA